MDEVFGSENFVALITFATTSGCDRRLPEARVDYTSLVREGRRARQVPPALSRERSPGRVPSIHQVELPDGEARRLTAEERSRPATRWTRASSDSTISRQPSISRRDDAHLSTLNSTVSPYRPSSRAGRQSRRDGPACRCAANRVAVGKTLALHPLPRRLPGAFRTTTYGTTPSAGFATTRSTLSRRTPRSSNAAC